MGRALKTHARVRRRSQVRDVRLQPSCSLQFLPWSLEGEEGKIRAAHPLVWPLLSFAAEKLGDLRVRRWLD